MILSRKTPFLILTLSAVITSSTSNVFGMDNQLCFYLNGNREIQASSAHGNMKFYVEPKEFEGKDILEVLPLPETTRALILETINIVTKENKILDVTYDLENNNYTAEITPLCNTHLDTSYFVKVWKTLMTTPSLTIYGMGPLCFYLDSARHIKAASAHNGMEFYVEQKEFENKDILDVLSLSESKRDAIIKTFNLATEENKIVDAPYELENSDYIAEITPLTNQTGNSYFVNVWGS